MLEPQMSEQREQARARPLDALKIDLARYGGWSGARFSWGAWAVISYRLGQAAADVPGIRGKVLRALHARVGFIIQGLSGVELPPRALFGPGLFIPHGGNIVVHENTRAGVDCVLLHGTTLGATGGQSSAPVLGDRVSVLVNASVLGAVAVGDDATVAGHALVVRDVPAGATVMGVPAKVFSPTPLPAE